MKYVIGNYIVRRKAGSTWDVDPGSEVRGVKIPVVPKAAGSLSMVAWTVTRLYSVHALGVNLDFHGEDMASTWREPGEDIFRLERNCQTFATFSATLSFAILIQVIFTLSKFKELLLLLDIGTHNKYF